RDLQAPSLGVDHGLAKAHDPTRKGREARGADRLVALSEEHLHPEADAEVGRAATDGLEHGLAEPARERESAALDGALSGHDQAIGAPRVFGIAREARPSARALEGPRDAVEVADAEIEDRHVARAHSVNVPFVEGTPDC